MSFKDVKNDELLTVLISTIKDLEKEVKGLKEERSKMTVYTNKTLGELLGVSDQLLKRYRDYGLLSYCHNGDKYWYTEADVKAFLAQNYYSAT